MDGHQDFLDMPIGFNSLSEYDFEGNLDPIRLDDITEDKPSNDKLSKDLEYYLLDDKEQHSNNALFGVNSMPLDDIFKLRQEEAQTQKEAPKKSKKRKRSRPKNKKPVSKKNKSYKCAKCKKDFAGASGLSYHNNYAYEKSTKERPHKKKKSNSKCTVKTDGKKVTIQFN